MNTAEATIVDASAWENLEALGSMMMTWQGGMAVVTIEFAGEA